MVPHGMVRDHSPRSAAPRREAVQEALEVIGVEDGRPGAAIAVGVAVACRKLVQEADEVVHVELRRSRGLIAVGVARLDDGDVAVAL